MLAIDRLKRIMSGTKRLSTIDGQNRDSVEVLEPPMACIRWSGERSSPPPPAPPQYNELPPYLKPRRSSSGDSLSTNSSGEIKSLPMESDYINTPSAQHKQAAVVPIKVKRSLSQSATNGMAEKETGAQPKMCQSFHAPPDRTSDYSDRENTPTGDDCDQMSRSPVQVAPLTAAKPKPVAMIVAKSKQSSREGSPDIIDIEKHEAERNLDGFKSPVKNLEGFKFPLAMNNGSLKRRTSDHIYDTPQLGPPRTVSSNYSNYPPLSMHQVQPAPGSPLHVNTQFSYSQTGSPRSSQQNSPGGRSKKAPPPPPKRNASLRCSDTLTKNGSSVQGINASITGSPITSVLSPPPIQQKPQIAASQTQAFVNCVQSLSEKFGKKSEENSCSDSVSSDSEEPPPVAMEIIEPKISNYGLLGKNDKGTSGEYMLQQRLKRESSSSSSPGNTTVESAFGVKLRQAQTETQTQNQSGDRPGSNNQSGAINSVTQSSVKENNGNIVQNAQVCVQQTKVNTDNGSSVTKEATNNHGNTSDQDKQRKNSTENGRGMDLSASTSSLDSNTLPFANENVGTIKQRAQQSKPSLVMVLDDSGLHGDEFEADCAFAAENTDTLRHAPNKLPKPQQPKVQSLQQQPLILPKPQLVQKPQVNQSNQQTQNGHSQRPINGEMGKPSVQRPASGQASGEVARPNGQPGQLSPNSHLRQQQYNASVTASFVPGTNSKSKKPL